MNARRRSRYAPDEQVKRAAKLALETGLRLKIDAQGGVEILGPLDSSAPAAMSKAGEETPDEALATWESQNGLARS